ncbi:flippase [Pontibacillus marinus]|uniref:Flippase n=1 Tax=Pontibacillus marinus BH030004 = DSM 16465 TaxID=1385511 RepID=A0A0A5GGA9_9BACI|nr:flippase [Pontibacillus marinus]KGX90999.1 flippase [Pontibacillus marinus BH030004 = DSM 16465]
MFLTKYAPKSLIKRLDSRINFKRIISNISWLFFDRIFRMGIGVFVSVWVARFLGPDRFGLLSYAQSFVALFTALSTLGLDGIVVRNLVKGNDRKEEILGTTLILKVMGGILVTILTVTIIFLIRGNDPLSTWLVTIVAIGTIFQAFNTIDFWFQSEIKSKYTVFAKGTSFTLVSVLKVGLILFEANLITFAIAGLIEIILGSIFMVIIYQSKVSSILKWKVNFSLAYNLLKDSWPLIFSSMVIVIYMKIDQLMIGELIGNMELGIYSAAVRLSEVWYFIPSAIVSTLAPVIAKAKKDGKQNEYTNHVQQLFNVVACIALGIAILISFLSKSIIQFLYGEEYVLAGDVLSVHIWAAIFVFLGVARNPYILNEGLMKFSFATNITGAIINILLNLALIPKYGIIGAAYATLISQMFASYLANIIYFKTRLIFIYQTKAIFFIWLWRKMRLIR